MRQRIIYAILPLLLFSCTHSRMQEKDKGIAISRKLEQAIEYGETYISERELIREAGRTEGTDAALKLFNELNHHTNYEAFRNCVKESDSIWREIPDSAEQQAVRSRMMPYLKRIIAIEEEINR